MDPAQLDEAFAQGVGQHVGFVGGRPERAVEVGPGLQDGAHAAELEVAEPQRGGGEHGVPAARSSMSLNSLGISGRLPGITPGRGHEILGEVTEWQVAPVRGTAERGVGGLGGDAVTLHEDLPRGWAMTSPSRSASWRWRLRVLHRRIHSAADEDLGPAQLIPDVAPGEIGVAGGGEADGEEHARHREPAGADEDVVACCGSPPQRTRFGELTPSFVGAARPRRRRFQETGQPAEVEDAASGARRGPQEEIPGLAG